MTMELAHESGCNERHTNRQQCNGPVVDARRLEAPPPRPPEIDQSTGYEYDWVPWRPSARFAAVLELVPGVAVAVVWIGSLPASLHYDDFAYLHLVALLPSFGWLWRGLGGCLTTPLVWITRLVLITIAAFMWLGANDLAWPFPDRPADNYSDHCCRPAYQIGMHSALAAAVTISALSAYGVGWWGRKPRVANQ